MTTFASAALTHLLSKGASGSCSSLMSIIRQVEACVALPCLFPGQLHQLIIAVTAGGNFVFTIDRYSTPSLNRTFRVVERNREMDTTALDENKQNQACIHSSKPLSSLRSQCFPVLPMHKSMNQPDQTELTRDCVLCFDMHKVSQPLAHVGVLLSCSSGSTKASCLVPSSPFAPPALHPPRAAPATAALLL